MPLNIKGCRAKVNQQMKKAAQATEKTQENAASQGASPTAGNCPQSCFSKPAQSAKIPADLNR